MKKILLRSIWLIAGTILAVAALWFFVFAFCGFAEGEYKILRNELQFTSKAVFQRGYWILVIATRVLTLVGLFVFSRWCFTKIGLSRQKAKTFIAQNPWIISWVTVALVLAVFEGYLRYKSLRPACFYSNFRPVEKLVSYPRHLADSTGMNYWHPRSWDGQVFHPVNGQGFLSDTNYTEETRHNVVLQNKKLVFGIGDSFMEGITDSGGYSATFPEIVRHDMDSTIAFWPFGVGGTDPLNYYLILNNYIKYKPDVVVVTFCAANDLMKYDRKPAPFVPQHFSTNAGFISSNSADVMNGPNRLLKTPDEAYGLMLERGTLTRRNDIWSRMLATTSITTQLYYMAEKKNYIIVEQGDTMATRHWLLGIDSLCKQAGAHCIFAFIPEKNSLGLNWKEKYARLFSGLHVLYPIDITLADYIPKDTHFNAQGNKKFALFLERAIVDELKKAP